MSCIATLYLLSESQRASFLTSKQRESRVEEKRLLFFTRRRHIAGEEVWQFLDRVAEKKTDLEFSGYLLVDYLFVYLQIRGDDFFQRLDEYCSALSAEGASRLAALLAAHPVDRAAIERYLKEDGRPLTESDRDDTLAAYESAHSHLLEWSSSIRTGMFGVLYLSF